MRRIQSIVNKSDLHRRRSEDLSFVQDVQVDVVAAVEEKKQRRTSQSCKTVRFAGLEEKVREKAQDQDEVHFTASTSAAADQRLPQRPHNRPLRHEEGPQRGRLQPLFQHHSRKVRSEQSQHNK